ncbi:hypothetical protein C5167_022912 [Papaver somniferum]|uniref:Uncharacterized protein n=1 Tax=Papaver somniferum TaxID=3469 RepID=A0A4Y7JMG2_PAPSO|nr:hypothetical protein C5167_022912 [Papaver somniferum]
MRERVIQELGLLLVEQVKENSKTGGMVPGKLSFMQSGKHAAILKKAKQFITETRCFDDGLEPYMSWRLETIEDDNLLKHEMSSFSRENRVWKVLIWIRKQQEDGIAVMIRRRCWSSRSRGDNEGSIEERPMLLLQDLVQALSV